MDPRFAGAESRRALARTLAREAMVLLKNEEETLPLPAGKTVALLGKTQRRAIIGGGGSGATSAENALSIPAELRAQGLLLEPVMEGFYAALPEGKPAEDFASADFAGLVASGAIYEIFGRYSAPEPEPLPGEDVFAASAAHTDTAILLLGRESGGEECDRRVEDDYCLTASERELVRRACAGYRAVIAVLDVNGPVDMTWAAETPEVKALLLMGTCGEQAAGALAELLTGRATPGGKLSQSVAREYTDWPSAGHMTYRKDDPHGVRCYADYGLEPEETGEGFACRPVTVYAEDIYVGYRYFDSFDKRALYPFGFGLSYASFAWAVERTGLSDGVFTLEATVRNTSRRYSGRETLQLYVHAPFGKLAKPYQELRAVAKTGKLAPGESQRVTLAFDVRALASFDEESMRYLLEPGEYTVLLGNSSRDTRPAARLRVSETLTVRRVCADIGMRPGIRGRLALLRPARELPVPVSDVPVCAVTAEDVSAVWPTAPRCDHAAGPVPSRLRDVKEGRVSLESFVAQLSAEELAVLCCGYGTGLPFMGLGQQAPMTIDYPDGELIGTNSHAAAFPGYCSPALRRRGIVSAWYKDGPAGVGMTAWPTGMMLACTFDTALLYDFGAACGSEAELLGVDSWLAPGLNLIRNPLEGRAFEYFSEDPFLCGALGVAAAKGAMDNTAVTVCPKHFALNEQETYRRGSAKERIDAVDSVVSARAARELYLKPFEMVVTQARPRTLMTSFNKVNGTFAAGSRTLCTDILRGEWGYDGVVVTDWGDLDIVVDGADALNAGNDVVMPGGPPVIAQILRGYSDGRVSLETLREAAAHLLKYVLASGSFAKAVARAQAEERIVIKPVETEEELRGRAYVHYKAWHEAYTGLIRQEVLDEHTLERSLERSRTLKDRSIVAKNGERVIGFVSFGPDRDDRADTGEVYALYVLREYYGTGVGARLLAAAGEALGEYPRLCLWALKANRRALRFYEKEGFRPDGAQKHSDSVGADAIRLVWSREIPEDTP